MSSSWVLELHTLDTQSSRILSTSPCLQRTSINIEQWQSGNVLRQPFFQWKKKRKSGMQNYMNNEIWLWNVYRSRRAFDAKVACIERTEFTRRLDHIELLTNLVPANIRFPTFPRKHVDWKERITLCSIRALRDRYVVVPCFPATIVLIACYVRRKRLQKTRGTEIKRKFWFPLKMFNLQLNPCAIHCCSFSIITLFPISAICSKCFIQKQTMNLEVNLEPFKRLKCWQLWLN